MVQITFSLSLIDCSKVFFFLNEACRGEIDCLKVKVKIYKKDKYLVIPYSESPPFGRSIAVQHFFYLHLGKNWGKSKFTQDLA